MPSLLLCDGGSRGRNSGGPQRRDGPLNSKLALEIAIQITRALMAAAAHSLIHRDLKPGNIMLTRGETDTAEPK